VAQENRASTDKTSLEGASLGVLLGSGLSGVSHGFPAGPTFSFDEFKGLSATDVMGHEGALQRCVVAGRPCIFVRGRRHYYEGVTDEIRSLIDLLHDLGVRTLLLTSAAGSLVKTVCPGELVLVEDLLDVQFRPVRLMPSAGPTSRVPSSIGRPERRRPLALDASCSHRVWAAASKANVALGRATAATCAGPAYETPAEILALQQAGVTLVTMSGAPEVEIANTLGIRVAMVALVTNWASGISSARLRHEDVLDVAGAATCRIRQLVEKFVEMSPAGSEKTSRPING